jgi:hypothetical protein
MTYGYSSRLIALNKQASKTKLGVALGRKCIAHDVPVSRIADQLGVSRMTIYNWFIGSHEPQPAHASAITKLLSAFK